MNKRSLLRAAATAVGGALLVTACGSGGTTQETSSPISARPQPGSNARTTRALDACDYVTANDASILFGHPATQNGTHGDGVCAWNALGNTPDGTILKFSLVAHAYNGTSAYTEPKVPGGHRVASVGQRAFVYSAGNTDTIQAVDHNKTVVLIYSVRSDGDSVPKMPDKAAKLAALARTAAGRL